MSAIGLRVGPFEIVEAVALPAPGDWYLARRAGSSRKQPRDVLVRLLDPDPNDDARTALQQTWERLRAIDDPRVPAAVAHYEGTGAIAITDARGIPLAEAIALHRAGELALTPATLIDVLLELTDSLQRLHGKGVVHGRLDPSKLALSPSGHVWIHGFGDDEPADPHYVPPEIARGATPGPHTDVWSVGVLACALVTARAPWPGDAPLELARVGGASILADKVTRQWPALGRAVSPLVASSLTDRPSDLSAFRQELLALARKARGAPDRAGLAAAIRNVEDDIPAVFAADADDEPEGAADDDEPVVDPPESSSGPEEPPAPTEEAPAEPAQPSEPVAATPDEGAPAEFRASPPLPEEQIPVVRPDVGDEVPTARIGGGEAPPRADQSPEADQEQEADVEPSEATILYDGGALSDALAKARAVDDADKPDVPTDGSGSDAWRENEATILMTHDKFDEAVLLSDSESGAHPTAVPATDPEDNVEFVDDFNDEVDFDAPTVMASVRGLGMSPLDDEEDGPAVGTPEEIPLAPPAPSAGTEKPTQIAMWLVAGLLLALAIWVFSTLT